MFRFVFSFIFLISFFVSNAQSCFDFHKSHCNLKHNRYPFIYNENSVSYLYKSGSTREIPFELISGIDYRMTICTDSVFNGVVAFQIVNEDGKVLFDNSKSNYNLTIEFTCKQSEQVELVITAPKPAMGISDTIVVEGCIGLLIENMVAPKTGF